MDHPGQAIYLGDTELKKSTSQVEGEYVTLLGEQYYCIRNYDRMPAFFMSIVSSSDHWMFISSTGGVTAGRASAKSALFPYYPDDRVAENGANTGHVAIFHVTRADRTFLWEPFSSRSAGLYRVERHIYKNNLGDKLVFEETNRDLGLTYRYAWRSSDRYGWVKTSWLVNDDRQACRVALLDGLQNILPCGTSTTMQSTFSNLLNAYKRNELDPQTGLATFSLSSTMSDLAEPSESLRATTVWQVGLEKPCILLSANQIDEFRTGAGVVQETDTRGRRGAYLAHTQFDLGPGEERQWSFVAELNQDSTRVVARINEIEKSARLAASLEEDILRGSTALRAIVASADGLQLSGDRLVSAHHFSNVLFNTMRGGIFARNYRVRRENLLEFMAVRNRTVLRQQEDFFNALPEEFDSSELIESAAGKGSADLERLCYEYLPLTFGRRHGDPSRPWNHFSINLKKPDGSQKLDYQGNWRDIFQNWEPLAWSYPEFTEQFICKFLNATTRDGYNPYRVTRDGIEWELPTPDDPWANIGYWGDHQIIYLEKLLEISDRFHPGRLGALLDRRIFSHANVPYRIKEYDSLLADWFNTIGFDHALDARIAAEVKTLGTDGKLVRAADGGAFHVSLAEKLLILLLAKLGNFVPEGGIWMNTQRPEWNDGNNALVGKGLSVVTLGYLRRYVVFCRGLFAQAGAGDLSLTREIRELFLAMQAALKKHHATLKSSFTDEQRRQVMDELGRASSSYRWDYYQKGVSGQFSSLGKVEVLEFLELALEYIEHSLKANERPDHLYHAYNVLHLGKGKASVGHLYEMLEGQVAILSSGLLTAEQSLEVLHSLRASSMYRPDQNSYMLYPDRDLAGFFKKNQVPPEKVKGLKLVAELARRSDRTLIVQDENGTYHFNGGFRNARDVRHALAALEQQEPYAKLVKAETGKILDLFETVFDHISFTGRSGTFFAYEGLGSIYWHMVSKLLLASQEAYLQAAEAGRPQEVLDALLECYTDIRNGLGFNKSPQVYGAFPTDPYSHTPAGQGARQPGMTGQVKEEILTRWAELGVSVEAGRLSFHPRFLNSREALTVQTVFDYPDVAGTWQSLELPAGSLAFTFCQVPVVYRSGPEEKIEVQFTDGTARTVPGSTLDGELSRAVFGRQGKVKQISVFHPRSFG